MAAATESVRILICGDEASPDLILVSRKWELKEGIARERERETSEWLHLPAEFRNRLLTFDRFERRQMWRFGGVADDNQVTRSIDLGHVP